MDELANPLQAALVSAASFAVGASLPLLAAASAQDWQGRAQAVAAVATLGLARVGALIIDLAALASEARVHTSCSGELLRKG